MKTPSDSEPFAPFKWTPPKDEIYDLFQAAILLLTADSWVKIDSAKEWTDVLPYPERLTAVLPVIHPSILVTQPFRAEGIRAIYQMDKSKWASFARTWFSTQKFYIRHQTRQVDKLIEEAIPIINTLYKKRLKNESVSEVWIQTVSNLPLSDFTRLVINTKNLSGFFAQQANEYKNRLTKAPVLPLLTAKEVEAAIIGVRWSNRKEVPFTELLIDFTEAQFDALLVHLKFKNEQGDTTLSKKRKSALHGLLNGLPKQKIKDLSRDRLYNSLCRYLGMEITDVKKGYNSKAEAHAERLTISYMKEQVLTQK